MSQSFDWNKYLFAFFDFFLRNAIGIALSIIILMAISHFAVGIAGKYLHQEEKKHSVKKWIRYVTAIFGILWLLVLYNAQSGKNTSFYLFLIGIILAGIAISVRDVFSNMVGWGVIPSSKGFRQGDRIKIGQLTGDVIDIGLLRTMIAEIGGWVNADQSTGRLVSMPNSMALTNEIYNFTQAYEFIWDEIRIVVTFESDWRKAETIMEEVAFRDFEEKKEQIQERIRLAQSRFLLRFNFISPKVYVRIADSGVELTLRYMVQTRRRRTAQDWIAREILERFAQEKSIEFAYPTMRIYRLGDPVPKETSAHS
jgi:small-conductance mechanosensitive channel